MNKNKIKQKGNLPIFLKKPWMVGLLVDNDGGGWLAVAN